MTAGETSTRQWIGAVLLIAWLLSLMSGASASDDTPLRPPDTSSPRATLQGFFEGADDIYRRVTRVLRAYATSDRLYLTAEERRQQLAALADASPLFRYLDLSRVPPVLLEGVAVERALQLKEILDRITVPPFASIPDQDGIAGQPIKRWRLPDTEIDIARIDSGPRAGEYLISADTIDRLPEFYERVKDLPYKPGAGQQLAELYQTIGGSGSTATIYDAFLGSPIGLGVIVPPRWMLGLPPWVRMRIADVSVWQWVLLGSGLVIGGLIVWAAHRVAWAGGPADKAPAGPHWRGLPVPLAIIVVAALLGPLFIVLRIGGSVREIIEYARTAAMYLSAAWLAIAAAAVFGDAIIASERLKKRSLDSQLIRLGTRLIGVAVAIAVLINGGDELGFPAYSVLAGLGVGGLAVALAAQSTIANLIGSLLIALEKPFRIGQSVRISGAEGTVEDVGFRSTRIRTSDDSLVSIPSSMVVNSTVENLGLRSKRRQRFLVQVTYNTPRTTLEKLIAGIRQLLADHPEVEAATSEVRLNNFAESSLDILVIFHLLVDSYAAELAEREAVLLRIMDLVKDAGVAFAFPSRTLYVEHAADEAAVRPAADATVIGFVARP